VTSAALQSGTNPRAPKTKSPVKRVIKAQLNRQQSKITKLEIGKQRLEMKVDLLKKQVRDFAIALNIILAISFYRIPPPIGIVF
jgi:hypothetical protein